jgi:hypothetical protein
MTIEQAIKDAVEKGGYHKDLLKILMTVKDEILRGAAIDHALLDPHFWQALGKARGWKGSAGSFYGMNMESWKLHWHRFVDHLAEGKDVESFFSSLT